MSKTFKLSNGDEIPAIGYGTGTKWFKYGRDELDENLVANLLKALKAGFVHIDGAEVYNTALEIGEALKKSGIPREKLWLTDKYFAGDGTYKAHSEAANPYESLKASLKRFGTDYVDLYLIHAPFIKKETHGFTLEEAWGYLEQLKKEGLAKHIGVSNFTVEDLERVLKVAKDKPEVHQIEFNPYLQNQTPGIVDFSKKNGILIESYSPLAPLYKGEKGALHEYLAELSKKYGKTDTQIVLRWTLQQGILPITTTSNESRLAEILDSYSFSLEEEEVAKISELGKAHGTLRQYWKPEYGKYD